MKRWSDTSKRTAMKSKELREASRTTTNRADPARPDGTPAVQRGAASFTIVGIATAPAAGGIGILRLSGPDALDAALRLAPRIPRPPAARRAYFTELTDGRGGVLDEGLGIYFSAPHSYTGEDVIELQ